MGALCCKAEEEIIDYSQGPELNHFHLLKIIGQGVYGKVRMVQHKKTKKKYALKYINKSICIKQKAVHNIIFERNLLENIEYPFIANLRYSFQDNDTLFMILDLMESGDLRYTLNSGSLSESQVRHHVASIALAVNYLHKKRICHRDIKPENILIDNKGYAHLSDFNMSYQFNPNQPLIWSMAGTIAYMAPEILARKGYSIFVDWWSLGIVTYELLFGMRPFMADSKEALLHNIIHEPLKFPDNHTISKECLDLVCGLLDKSPFQRLGTNFEDFKNHPWFQGLDWELLERKQFPLDDINQKAQLTKREFEEDELTKRKSLPVKRNTLLLDASPVTEEAKYRLQLEEQFLQYDFSTQMVQEHDTSFIHQFLEHRRNSLKKQYDRLKRRSFSYQELFISQTYSD